MSDQLTDHEDHEWPYWWAAICSKCATLYTQRQDDKQQEEEK